MYDNTLLNGYDYFMIYVISVPVLSLLTPCHANAEIIISMIHASSSFSFGLLDGFLHMLSCNYVQNVVHGNWRLRWHVPWYQRFILLNSLPAEFCWDHYWISPLRAPRHCATWRWASWMHLMLAEHYTILDQTKVFQFSAPILYACTLPPMSTMCSHNTNGFICEPNVIPSIYFSPQSVAIIAMQDTKSMNVCIPPSNDIILLNSSGWWMEMSTFQGVDGSAFIPPRQIRSPLYWVANVAM